MCNILIIDDKSSHITAVRDALELFGYQKENIYPSQLIEEEEDERGNHEIFSEKINTLACEKKYDDIYFMIVKIIEKNNIDLVFLDLNHCPKDREVDQDTPPNSSGELLASKLLKNKLYENLPIVVYSRFDKKELIKKKTKINDLLNLKNLYYISTVTEDFSSSEKFLNKMEEFKLDKEKLDLSAKAYVDNRYQTDVAIICALDDEYRYILDFTDSWIDISGSNNYKYKKACITHNNKILNVVAYEMADMGPDKAAAMTTTLISDTKPRYVVMTGIAAGIKNDKIRLGDILIPQIVKDWQSGKHEYLINESIFKENPKSLEIDKIFKEAIKELKKDTFAADLNIEFYNTHVKKIKEKEEVDRTRSEEDFLEEIDVVFEQIETIKKIKPKIFTDNMVSGSSVVANSKIVNEIKVRKLMGIDMEIYGVFSAVEETGSKTETCVIAIKGVSDFADPEKEDGYRQFAAFASAQTLYKLFTEYIDMDKK